MVTSTSVKPKKARKVLSEQVGASWCARSHQGLLTNAHQLRIQTNQHSADQDQSASYHTIIPQVVILLFKNMMDEAYLSKCTQAKAHAVIKDSSPMHTNSEFRQISILPTQINQQAPTTSPNKLSTYRVAIRGVHQHKLEWVQTPALQVV